MRKFIGILICFLLFLPFDPAAADAKLVPAKARLVTAQAQPSAVIDTSALVKGVVSVAYASKTGKKVKAGITKDGKTYYYDLPNNGQKAVLPLQMQNGTYSVTVFEQTTGTSYKAVKSQKVSLNLKDPKIVFLQSVQNINWSSSMAPAKAAASLVKGKSRTEDKIKAIHSYVAKNVKYDYAKYKTVQSGYIPDINTAYTTKKGICYDYASLFGAMLRSQGIPAKLVTGYSTKVKGLHAWNEVYIKELNKWVIVDTTVDSTTGSYTAVYKNASDFKKLNEY